MALPIDHLEVSKKYLGAVFYYQDANAITEKVNEIIDEINSGSTGGGTATSVTVDNTSFENISGTNVQEVLESVDEALNSSGGTVQTDGTTINGNGNINPITAISPVVENNNEIDGYTINNPITIIHNAGSGYKLNDTISINNVTGTAKGVTEVKESSNQSFTIGFTPNPNSQFVINDDKDILFVRNGYNLYLRNYTNISQSFASPYSNYIYFSAGTKYIGYANKAIVSGTNTTDLVIINKIDTQYAAKFLYLSLESPITQDCVYKNITYFGKNSSDQDLYLIYLNSSGLGSKYNYYIVFNNVTETIERTIEGGMSTEQSFGLIRNINGVVYGAYQDFDNNVINFRVSDQDNIFTAPNTGSITIPTLNNVNTEIKSIATDGNGTIHMLLSGRMSEISTYGAILISKDNGVTWSWSKGLPGFSISTNSVTYDGDKFILIPSSTLHYSLDGENYNSYINSVGMGIYKNTTNQGFYVTYANTASIVVYFIDQKSGFLTNVDFGNTEHQTDVSGTFTDSKGAVIELFTETTYSENVEVRPLNQVNESITAKSYVDTMLMPNADNNKTYDWFGAKANQFPTKQYVDDLVNTSIIIKPTGSGYYKWVDLDIAVSNTNVVTDTSLRGSILNYEFEEILSGGNLTTLNLGFSINSAGNVSTPICYCDNAMYYDYWYNNGYVRNRNIFFARKNGKLYLVLNQYQSSTFNINVWKDNQIDKRNISIEVNNTHPENDPNSVDIWWNFTYTASGAYLENVYEKAEYGNLEYSTDGTNETDQSDLKEIIYYISFISVDDLKYANGFEVTITGDIYVENRISTNNDGETSNDRYNPNFIGRLPYVIKVFKEEYDERITVTGDFDIQSRLVGDSDVITFEPYYWFDDDAYWDEEDYNKTLNIGFKVTIHNDTNPNPVYEVGFHQTKPNVYYQWNSGDEDIYDNFSHWWPEDLQEELELGMVLPIIGKQTQGVQEYKEALYYEGSNSFTLTKKTPVIEVMDVRVLDGSNNAYFLSEHRGNYTVSGNTVTITNPELVEEMEVTIFYKA